MFGFSAPSRTLTVAQRMIRSSAEVYEMRQEKLASTYLRTSELPPDRHKQERILIQATIRVSTRRRRQIFNAVSVQCSKHSHVTLFPE
jgi:hypothetical protein